MFFVFLFFLFKHIIPWSGLDIGYRLAWVPGIFLFLLFILKRNTIRTFFLPVILYAQLNCCERRGERAGQENYLYRSITIILSYHPSSVCPNSLLTNNCTTDGKQENGRERKTQFSAWYGIVWWLTESCGERARERKISPGIILSPPPPTPHLP